MLRFFFIILVLLLSACAQTTISPEQATRQEPAINMSSYSGTWYEIAAIPDPVQRDCLCSMSHYTLIDKYIRIKRSCWRGTVTGKWLNIYAKAYPIAGSRHIKFNVHYDNGQRATYWILYMDPHYQYGLIGTPDHQHLAIMSRRTDLDDASYKKLQGIAMKLGYEIGLLQITDQSC